MFEVSFMMRGLLFLFHFMLFEDVCASILQSVCGVQQMTTQITRFCDFFQVFWPLDREKENNKWSLHKNNGVWFSSLWFFIVTKHFPLSWMRWASLFQWKRSYWCLSHSILSVIIAQLSQNCKNFGVIALIWMPQGDQLKKFMTANAFLDGNKYGTTILDNQPFLSSKVCDKTISWCSCLPDYYFSNFNEWFLTFERTWLTMKKTRNEDNLMCAIVKNLTTSSAEKKNT